MERWQVLMVDAKAATTAANSLMTDFFLRTDLHPFLPQYHYYY